MDADVQVAVVGAGYVGLVTAACLADRGHHVTCIDKDPLKVQALTRGDVPFHEPGLKDLVKAGLGARRLAFTVRPEDAMGKAGVVIVAVGTPTGDDGAADTSAVESVVKPLGAAFHGVVVIRSTVPPGTGDRLQALNPKLQIVNAPEFLAEGTAVHDFQRPDRVVLGGERDAVEQVRPLFEVAGTPLIRTTRTAAEMGKYASNAFLAARVSLVNEVANLCGRQGVDVREVARIVGLDKRIGTHFLRAGIGFGGSCFPKDVKALAHEARRLGVETPVLDATLRTNDAQWRLATLQILSMLEGIQDPVASMWGVAFKPGTDDIREAPGLRIAAALQEAGVQVRFCDPVAKAPGASTLTDPVEAATGADCVVHVTEWPQFAAAQASAVASVTRTKKLFDGRNTLDAQAYRDVGFEVVTAGGA